MKAQNYKQEDLAVAIEEKKKVMHHIEQIEKDFWLDNVDEAIKRVAVLHLSLVKLSQMQSAKKLENNFNYLHQMLNANGIHVQVIPFKHKKTE